MASLDVQGPDSSKYVTLGLGEMAQFIALPVDEFGDPIEDLLPFWESSNTGAATVNQVGVVTGVGMGVTKVSASVDTVTAYRPVVVNIPGTGVEYVCDPGVDVGAARDRLEDQWFDQPHVMFTVGSGTLTFTPQPWQDGRTCLFPHEVRANVAHPVDLAIEFPGGAWFLSMTLSTPEGNGGQMATADITYADGSTTRLIVRARPRVENLPGGAEGGAIATLDLTDEVQAIRRVEIFPVVRIYYDDLQFYSGAVP